MDTDVVRLGEGSNHVRTKYYAELEQQLKTLLLGHLGGSAVEYLLSDQGVILGS